jgi:hypothetical protein
MKFRKADIAFLSGWLASILLVTSVADSKEVFLNEWYSYFLSNIYWQGFNGVTYSVADYYFAGPFDISGEFSVNLIYSVSFNVSLLKWNLKRELHSQKHFSVKT